MAQHHKRLVVCLDGTWNTPDSGAAPSNVVKIMQAIRRHDDAGIPQVTYYSTGVGTGGLLDRLLGGVFGVGLEKNLLDAYRFLANNYRDGDEIYLFGFSRGAFTARSLAGFLGLCGLLDRTALGLLPRAWSLYRTAPSRRDAARLAPLRTAGRADVRVRCLGVWDTVGALGIPGEMFRWWNRRRHQFHDTRLGTNIDFAFHAIAIDEKRGPFAPALWREPDHRSYGLVEQVWFPGVHSNVGGSYPDAGLSDMALRWMVQRVGASTGLAFDPAHLREQIAEDPLGDIYESRTALYLCSRMLPFQRLIGQNPVPRSWIRRLVPRSNLLPAGQRFAGEMIHWSALERIGRTAGCNGRQAVYQPENLRSATEWPEQTLPVVRSDGTAAPPLRRPAVRTAPRERVP